MNVNNIFTNIDMIKVKKPYINNLKEFLMLAQSFGFNLRPKALHKQLQYKYGNSIEIIINLTSGLITFDYFESNIKSEITRVDKEYLLRDYKHYIIWR